MPPDIGGQTLHRNSGRESRTRENFFIRGLAKGLRGRLGSIPDGVDEAECAAVVGEVLACDLVLHDRGTWRLGQICRESLRLPGSDRIPQSRER